MFFCGEFSILFGIYFQFIPNKKIENKILICEF